MRQKKNFIAAIFFIFGLSAVYAQNNVGIGTTTPNPNAILEMQSTNQGVLVPRMTTVQRNAIAAPTEGLLVYDIDVNCFFFYESSSASWTSLCNAGGVGPAGPQGPAGPTGATGPAGSQGATGPAGPAGTNGMDGAAGAPGPAGPMGATGPAGPAGANGMDGATGPAGPQGPMGATGPAGPQGPAGANGMDGAAGPQGPMGATGPAGPAGATGATGATGPQGPPGVINKYHVYGTAGRTGVNNTTLTVQPGMTQTFTLSAPSTVIIWATIGALNTTLTTTGYSTVDMVVHVDGNPLANGGWNRMFITNTSVTTGLGNCAINTMITLPAGTHTIDLRTNRSSGTSVVTIGGNSALEVNPGELTIMVLN